MILISILVFVRFTSDKSPYHFIMAMSRLFDVNNDNFQGKRIRIEVVQTDEDMEYNNKNGNLIK